MGKNHPAEVRAREYAKRHGVSMIKARELSQIEYRDHKAMVEEAFERVLEQHGPALEALKDR